MLSVLKLIYCFLRDIPYFFHDMFLRMFDSLLSVADGLIGSISAANPLAVPIWDNQYMYIAGAAGLPQALAIIAGALSIRFLLQLIPFTRLGS